jgi:hypothetical protein
VSKIEPATIEDSLLLRLIYLIVDKVAARYLEDPLGRVHQQSRLGVIRVHGISFL